MCTIIINFIEAMSCVCSYFTVSLPQVSPLTINHGKINVKHGLEWCIVKKMSGNSNII